MVAGAGSIIAAGDQASAAANAQNLQMEMYYRNLANEKPYMDSGKNALTSIEAGLGTGPSANGINSGQFTHQFNNSDLNANLAPNYAFQLGQGAQALNNQNSVSGGLVGGNALKAMNDYAQNYAANAYQQAYDNYNNNQSNIFNRLSSIAGLGQNAAAGVGNNGAQAASNAGSAALAGGAARAAGTVGASNSLNQLGQFALMSKANGGLGWGDSIAGMFGGAAGGGALSGMTTSTGAAASGELSSFLAL